MAFVSCVRPTVALRAKAVVGAKAKASSGAPRRVVAQARGAAWAPGNQAPVHLDGTLPGDFGFDPLNLGEDPKTLAWYSQAELIHARFAMLALAHCVAPSLAGKIGISYPGAGVEWYEAGTYDGYFTSTNTLLTVQFLMMGWAEVRRYLDLKVPGSQASDPIFTDNTLPEDGAVGYPGGIFDPFNYAEGGLAELQLKEIKNGRLAMMAMVGVYAQYAATGVSPLDNLSAHLADPWNVNIITTLSDAFVWDYSDLKQSWVGPVISSGVGYPAL